MVYGPQSLQHASADRTGGFDIANIVKRMADMAEMFGGLKCLQEDIDTVQH